MANKYPTTTATKNSGKTLAHAKAKDFLSPGGFLNTGHYTIQLQSLNKAQAVRLLLAKVVPPLLNLAKQWLEQHAPPTVRSGAPPDSWWSITTACSNPGALYANMNRWTEVTKNCTPLSQSQASIDATWPPVSGYTSNSQLYCVEWLQPALLPNYRVERGLLATRRVGAPVPTPAKPTGAVADRPHAVARVAPMAWPQPLPKAQPWAKADTGAEPSTQTKPRPRPYDLPLLPVPVIDNSNLGQNDGELDAVPVDQHYQHGHDGGGRVTVRPGPTRNEAPGRGTKQKKINVVSVGGRVWVLLNMATEGIDFVQAMWQAIPKEQRRKCTTPQCMLRDLYDNMHEIDMEQAVENYLNMQLTDYLSALLGVPTKKLSQVLGHITGVDHAINQMTSMWQLASKNDGKGGIEVNLGDLFPKIDFSVTDGTVSLNIPAVGGVQIDLATLGVTTGGKR